MKTMLAALAMLVWGGNLAQAQTPYLGQIYVFAFNFCPPGFTAPNGQLLSIMSNTALFSLLGTTYGGDGRTTFGLPTVKPIFTQNRATLTQCIALEGIFPPRS